MRCRWLLLLGCLVTVPAWAKKVDLDYLVRLLPDSGQAEVRITLAEGSAVRTLDFDLGRQGLYDGFQADGQWQVQGSRGVWHPAAGKSSLSYRVQLDTQSARGRPESRITAHWALLRGERLVPAARLDQQDGSELVARLQFELPQGWNSVETAWPRIGKHRFRIDDVSRLFDRPTGWMLAGTLGSRRAQMGDTQVTIAAPLGQGMRRMDTLTLMTFVWPQLQAVFARAPGKLLVVGSRDELGRGAQTPRNSLYLHSSRALIGEDGSSPLLRQLVRVFTQLESRDRSEWVVQSLTDYYASELLRRAGGIGDDRYQLLQRRLQSEGVKVTTLRGDQVNAAQVARGVLVLQALDREIRLHSHDQRSLDDVTRALMRLSKISTDDLVHISEQVLGREAEVLQTRQLLR